MSQAHKVLLVDDEDSIRKAIRRVLKYEPYEILEASHPREALEIVRKTDIHLVLSDHLMPDMLGMDLLRNIRLVKPEVIRIVLTGHAELSMAMQAINEGAIYRFLTKPWDNNEILVSLRLGLRHYEIEAENRRLLALVHKHHDILMELERRSPGSTGMKRTEDGRFLLDDIDITRELEDLTGKFLSK
jgi:DNA-binding NtrC family response regulator